MLRRLVYPKVEPLLNQAAGFCSKKNLTPNQLTFAGLVLNLLAAWIYASGVIFVGGLMILIAALGDLLDGPLARLTGKSSQFGAFLDSTVDRYSDFFLFSGIAYYFANEGSWGWFLVTLGILLGAFLTSYTKARAENFLPNFSVGLLERAERIIILALGSILTPLFHFSLVILLIGTHATALQRIWSVKKSLS